MTLWNAVVSIEIADVYNALETMEAGVERLEAFSTAGLPPHRRVEFWNDLASGTFTPVVADPVDFRQFSPSLMRSLVSDIRAAYVRSDPSVAHHTRSHVARATERMFFMHVQISGQSINLQGGREACLSPGDFMLFDSSRPYRIIFQARNDALVMGIPDKTLRRHMSTPEDVVAMAMSYKVNLNRLLSDTAQALWKQCQEGMSQSVASMLSRAFLQLTASAYAATPGMRSRDTSMAGARRMRILGYIEQHLVDQDLTPTQIAAHMNVTPRYLHLMFSGAPETLARYILRRRLEECARVLVSECGAGRSVSEIAFDYGFGSLTHFGKVFREKYGMTPSEYRRQHAVNDSAPIVIG